MPRQPLSNLSINSCVPEWHSFWLFQTACLGLLIASHAFAQSWDQAIASGEFSTAFRQAAKIDDPAERDLALAEIAKAQRAAGAHQAADTTALEIVSDSIQAQVFSGANQAASSSNLPGGDLVSGGQGGGSQADFGQLIELITTTVAPETWEEIGGTGTIAPFPNGVLVDANGLLRPLAQESISSEFGNRDGISLETIHSQLKDGSLVRVSLPRLEDALLRRRALGLPADATMCALADMERIEYVMVYPTSHDLVLVGPPSTQRETAHEGVLARRQQRLGMLATILHNALSGDGTMVCSITPRQANLHATQQFLTASAATPLRPGARQGWLKQIREILGRQDIELQGVAPDSYSAHVMVEADYHMKLVGMGLVPGVPGVTSYLDSVTLDDDGSLPPMAILRWWFTLGKAPITSNVARTAFRVPDRLLRVQSENELLAARGERIHTGQSEQLNQQFAASFTQQLPELSEKYPIYRELRMVCEMAVAAAIIREEGLLDLVGWQPTLLTSLDPYLVTRFAIPREVDSIINHRLLDPRHFVAGVSGGVDLSPLRDLPAIELRDDYQVRANWRESDPKTDRQIPQLKAIRWHW